MSYLLGLYFRHFGNFNKTYGTLGAAIVLMVWLYWTGIAMLVGAELNEELAKIRSVESALDGAFRTQTIDITWDASSGAEGLERAVLRE